MVFYVEIGHKDRFWLGVIPHIFSQQHLECPIQILPMVQAYDSKSTSSHNPTRDSSKGLLKNGVYAIMSVKTMTSGVYKWIHPTL